MIKMTHVLVTGIAVQDIVFKVRAMPRDNGKHYAASRSHVIGGIAANASSTIARLGGHAHIATCLGNDAVGRSIANQLKTEGVDTAGIEWADNCQSSLSAVLVDDDGERLLINHADPDLFERAPKIIQQWRTPLDAVMTDTRWHQGAHASLELARRLGVPSIVDFDRVPDYDPVFFLERASHIVFGEAALLALSGSAILDDALRSVRRRSDAFLAATAGGRGVYWLDGGEVRHMPAYKIDVVDTLAAGDVFHGALALELGGDQSLPHALRFASAAAALKCRAFGGGRGAPDRRTVEQFMREHQ